MTKRVPWANWTEWSEVKDLLDRNPLEALPLLQRWKVRTALPMRVECTRLILAVIQETSAEFTVNSLMSSSESQLLALYMCLVRVVNHLCDLQVTSTDRSFLTKALVLGIPEYVIEVRHQATHGELPDSFLVAKGLFDLFDWLIVHYWIEQSKSLATDNEKISNLLRKFQQKAKSTSDLYALAMFADRNFVGIDKSHRTLVAKSLVKNHTQMQDEVWGLLFLRLKPFFPKLGEAVIQSALETYKSGKLSLKKVSGLVGDLIDIEEQLNLSTSIGVKHLIIQSNTNVQALQLAERMVKCFVDAEKIKKLLEVSKFGTLPEGTFTECKPLETKEWVQIKGWQPKPIGAYSQIT